MSAEAAGEKKKLSLGGKAKSFFSGVKDALKDAATIDLTFDNQEARLKGVVQCDGAPRELPIFGHDEAVTGKVAIAPRDGKKKVEHIGIKVQLFVRIEMYYEKTEHELSRVDRTLSEKGDLTAPVEHRFDFTSFDRSFESYYGNNIKLRYFIRVTIERAGMSSNIVCEQDFIVQRVEALPEQNPPIKMEVGIEDCLHICFNYDRSRLYLNEAVTGTIEFKLVRLKVHTMELSIIRKEMTGVGASAFSETDTLAKFELMDGLPVKAEVVPLRWYMGGIDLTPTFKSVDNKFSVKYFVNLVLIDEQERKYFKQQEIHFFRSKLGTNDFKQYIAPKKTKERLAKEAADAAS